MFASHYTVFAYEALTDTSGYYLWQCMDKVTAPNAEKFCCEGVRTTGPQGQDMDVVVRIASYIADRPEAQDCCDCPHQVCFKCARPRHELWKAGVLATDAPRMKYDVLTDIATAKTLGTWRALPGQPGPSSTNPRPLWDTVRKQALPDCKLRLKECCKALRVTEQSFICNALFNIPFFDPLQQTFVEPLHVLDLGIWVDLVFSSIWTIKMSLQRWLKDDGVTPIISAERWKNGPLARISSRLQEIGRHCPGLRVNEWLSEVGARADYFNENPAKSSCGVRASEQRIIMMTFPLVLPSLVDEEFAEIAAYYTEHPQAQAQSVEKHEQACRLQEEVNRQRAAAKAAAAHKKAASALRQPSRGQRSDAQPPPPVPDDPDSDLDDLKDPDKEDEDPTGGLGKLSYLRGQTRPVNPVDDIVSTLLMWCDLYCDIRRPEHDTDELDSLAQSIKAFQERVLVVFPFKSGQNAGWNTSKFHDLTHIPYTILWMGWLENASAQAPEHCHQHFVKAVASMTNRNPNWTITAMGRLSIHHLLQEIQHVVLDNSAVDAGVPPSPPPSPPSELVHPSERTTGHCHLKTVFVVSKPIFLQHIPVLLPIFLQHIPALFSPKPVVL